MEQETASALLQFWLIAESFRTHMSSLTRTPDIDTDTADAIAIYDRYIHQSDLLIRRYLLISSFCFSYSKSWSAIASFVEYVALLVLLTMSYWITLNLQERLLCFLSYQVFLTASL